MNRTRPGMARLFQPLSDVLGLRRESLTPDLTLLFSFSGVHLCQVSPGPRQYLSCLGRLVLEIIFLHPLPFSYFG